LGDLVNRGGGDYFKKGKKEWADAMGPKKKGLKQKERGLMRGPYCVGVPRTIFSRIRYK